MAQEYQTDLLQLTWSQRIKFVRVTSVFFAITVMVYTRRKLGFRMMNPTVLTILTIVLLTIAALFQEPLGPHVFPFVLYALGVYGLGMYQRWQRWTELCNGERWHTYSPGISYLEALPWPAFMQRCRRINRFVEPPFVIVVGMVIGLTLSRGLGAWLIWSGVFLFIFEQDLFEKTLASSLDSLDGLIGAEIQEENVKHFEGAQPEQKQRTLEDTAGIPTGIAPDIEKQVTLRKAKRAALDNLASEAPATPA
jgi:hypothetical protein